jgi:uncharacterized protein
MLFLLIGLGVGSALYTSDLEQKNPETIFLTKRGVKEYQKFLAKTSEQRVLIVSLTVKPLVGVQAVERYQKIVARIEELAEGWDEKFLLVTPAAIEGGQRVAKKMVSSGQQATGPVRLLGQEHLAFLISVSGGDLISFAPVINQLKMELFGHPEVVKGEFAGIPYTNYLLNYYSVTIKERAFPLMMALSLIILILLSGKIVTALLIFTPALLGAAISLVPLKYWFGSVNMVTSIVPLMIFAIILALSFHLFAATVRARSFLAALREKRAPIMLMVSTTCVGFASLLVAPIPAITHFGGVVAILVPLLSLLTLFWFLAMNKVIIAKGRELEQWNLPSWIGQLFKYSLPKKVIYLGLILAVVAGVLGARNIEVITDATRYFPVAEGIKVAIDDIHRKVVGVPLYEIFIPHQLKGEQLSLDQLKRLDQLEERVAPLMPASLHVQGVLSANSIVKSANQSYLGQRKLPDSLPAYRLLWGRVPEGVRKSYSLESGYKISILGLPVNFSQYQKGLVRLERYLAEEGVNFQLNGLYYNLMISQAAMIKTLAQSFLLALLIVGVISSLYLRRGALFFIFLTVNIGPALLSLAASYLFGLSLNIATVMTYSIAMGMIVDSSFHLVHALDVSIPKGYQHYLTTTVLPIVASSLLLIVTVMLLGLNQFLPLRQFGINLGIILFFGLLFDLYVLPTLLLGHNRVKEEVDDIEV